MTQLVQPNLNAVGRIGWCLEYAGPKTFGTTYVPDPNSAWQAWTETKLKHYDSPPTDVAVPMWYSYFADLDGKGVKNWGHVTINVPGKGIYSSPYQTGTTHAVLPTIAKVESTYGVKYVGWSEDILNLKVIGGTVPYIAPETIVSTFADFGVPGPTADQIKYYTNHPNGYDELHTDLLKYNYAARKDLEAQLAKQVPTVVINGKEYGPK